VLAALGSLAVVHAPRAAPPESAPAVAYAELEGSVNPGSSDYLVRAIKLAEKQGSSALVIRLDTPGGMVEPTREIVKTELASKIPVVVWVGPSGARAGSAGVFITVAAHVAAMAPATNIGAAHPVQMGPGGTEKPDETMSEKITNDLAAWAQGIAAQRGRNGEWVVEAVRKSVSVPAEEALKLKVVDLVAPDLQSLLKQIDGRRVETSAGTVTLATQSASIRELKMTPRERFLDALGDPNIAFLLIGLGVLGILAELYHPGTIVPGLVGAVSLSIGLVATRMLPVRTGALVMIGVGAALIAAEFFVTSWGLFAVAGTICFALGAFLLVNPAQPGYLVDRDFGVQWSSVLPIVLLVAGVFAVVIWKVAQSRRTRPTVGAAGLIGEQGVAVSEVGPEGGKIRVRGELWTARSELPICKDQRVTIEKVDGLLVTVNLAEPRQ
jgi:membrane-bound serine protease (ClpP class)